MENKTTKIKYFCRPRFFPKNPRAQISAQFAWIFILIAGAIILIFFISIVFKQKAISEQKLSAIVINQLETILTGARISSGTVNVIDTPELKMELICDKDGFSTYFVNNIDGPEDFPQAIFAPDTIKGKKLITWALGWSAPFKVMNFLFLTSPDIRYIFVYEPGNYFAEKIYSDFPEEMFKENIIQSDIKNIKNLNSPKVRFIFFEGGDVKLPSFFYQADVSAIQINQGNINFYRKSGLDFELIDSIFYMDKASMYGAIFSQDIISYECNMKKAFKRLNLISQIYSDRENELKSYFTIYPDPRACKLYYHNKISNLISHSNLCSQDFDQCIILIDKTIGEIKQRQDVLIRNSCPLLY